MKSIVVFDYGFGNVRSMMRAIANLGVDVTLTSDHVQALAADGLVVPGVGAFAACVKGLHEVGGDDVIYHRIQTNKPVLGVCVGQQIMFDSGTEGGSVSNGLGLISGSVDRLNAPVVPHMGWNTVETDSESSLFKGVKDERFYFVHSYAATSTGEKSRHESLFTQRFDTHVAWCEYGDSRFIAAFEKGPLSATQFHPEKSAEAGSQLLRNWVDSL